MDFVPWGKLLYCGCRSDKLVAILIQSKRLVRLPYGVALQSFAQELTKHIFTHYQTGDRTMLDLQVQYFTPITISNDTCE
jgi:hypothetical protein